MSQEEHAAPEGASTALEEAPVQGWTGRKCPECNGHGQNDDGRTCGACAGTGDEYGPPPGSKPAEEGTPEPGSATRHLTEEELKKYGAELQKAVGRHGAVTVEGQRLHLYTAGRKNFRACERASKRLTHWPAGIAVVTHRVAPKVPPTAEEMVASLRAQQPEPPAAPEVFEHPRGLTTEQMEQTIALSELKAGRPYTEAEKAGLRSSLRGGLLL